MRRQAVFVRERPRWRSVTQAAAEPVANSAVTLGTNWMWSIGRLARALRISPHELVFRVRSNVSPWVGVAGRRRRTTLVHGGVVRFAP